MKKEKVVYIAKREDGLIKIGISSSPERRRRDLQNQLGLNIIDFYHSSVCSNAAKIEKTLHEQFKDKRKNGEWFVDCFKDAVEYLCFIRKEYDFEEVVFTDKYHEEIAKKSSMYNTLLHLAKEKIGLQSHLNAIDFVVSTEGKYEEEFLESYDKLSWHVQIFVEDVIKRNTILILHGFGNQDRKKVLEQFAIDLRPVQEKEALWA